MNPEKIRNAIEKQRRIIEKEKKRKAKRTVKTKENTRTYIKEDNYTYDKKTEKEIHEENLCHYESDNCAHDNENIKKKEKLMHKIREKELKRAILMEEIDQKNRGRTNTKDKNGGRRRKKKRKKKNRRSKFNRIMRKRGNKKTKENSWQTQFKDVQVKTLFYGKYSKKNIDMLIFLSLREVII